MAFRICLILALSAFSASAIDSSDFIHLGTSTRSSASGIGIQANTAYFLSKAKATWNDAYFACRAFNGGALIAIETEAENSEVKDFIIMGNAINVNFWTGGLWDAGSTQFRWISTGGSADFGTWGRWMIGHPTRFSGYNMVFKNQFFGVTEWETEASSNSNFYICEV